MGFFLYKLLDFYFLAVVPEKLFVNIVGTDFVKDNRAGVGKLKNDAVRIVNRKTHNPLLRPVEFVRLEPRVERVLTEYHFPLFGTSLYFFGQLFVLPPKLCRVTYLHTLQVTANP